MGAPVPAHKLMSGKYTCESCKTKCESVRKDTKTCCYCRWVARDDMCAWCGMSVDTTARIRESGERRDMNPPGRRPKRDSRPTEVDLAP